MLSMISCSSLCDASIIHFRRSSNGKFKHIEEFSFD
jgi:hypothetical protein